MRPLFLTAGALLLGACAPVASSAVEPVIFGADDRVELYEVRDNAQREAFARAVPAMIHASRVHVDTSGSVTFDAQPLGPSHELCEGEAHYDQPSAVSCSATLIDDDLVLTAGHCVDGWPCAEQRFVFGWYYDEAGVLHARRSDDVFRCSEVVVTELTSANDYAIVRLDRAAAGPPLPVRLEPAVVGEAVSLAGYPFGIPMKVVEHGEITANASRSRFYARLDAQPGNSGSGVFDEELRLLGDLTNGPVEALVRDGSCNRLAVIDETSWRTELISSVVPAVEALCASAQPSERLCGACGDGVCGPVEVCPSDCDDDAGMPDATVVVPPDAAIADAAVAGGPDAGPVALATHCGCAIPSRRIGLPSRFGALGVALGLALVVRRRRRR
ncbi:MAG: serine protease [Sandaracinaceae bacterium]|nr:serine protease [Sandaracinaceae bacterium]